jgi:hypothetical protein
MIQLRNIHTNDIITAELIETAVDGYKTTYTVRLNGVIQTLTSHQGWMIWK